jgi:hypothetical protein
LGIGDWGLGIGDLGIGDWAQSPIPNPQSPIPNPQSPSPFHVILIINIIFILNNKTLKIIQIRIKFFK